MNEMTFRQAIRKLARGEKTRAAIRAVFDAVEPLCRTRTDGNGGEETELWEWLESGEYHTDDTPQQLAAEWDALTEQARG